MPTMQVTVEAFIRDGEGQIITVETAPGTTEDDGATVIIPNGYVPNLLTTPAVDVRVTLHLDPIFKQPAELVTRVNDAEANTSTLTFTFPA